MSYTKVCRLAPNQWFFQLANPTNPVIPNLRYGTWTRLAGSPVPPNLRRRHDYIPRAKSCVFKRRFELARLSSSRALQKSFHVCKGGSSAYIKSNDCIHVPSLLVVRYRVCSILLVFFVFRRDHVSRIGEVHPQSAHRIAPAATQQGPV